MSNHTDDVRKKNLWKEILYGKSDQKGGRDHKPWVEEPILLKDWSLHYQKTIFPLLNNLFKIKGSISHLEVFSQRLEET